MDKDAWDDLSKQMKVTHVIPSSTGKLNEIFPGGENVFVQWSERLDYVKQIEESRINEFNSQIEAICKC